MSIRGYLESILKNYNGNNRVIGTLSDGTKLTLVFEEEGLAEDELMDVDTGMKFKKEDFSGFENTTQYQELKVRTKNHQARNFYAYKEYGRNHQVDHGNLGQLIK
ncbi:MAG: hypothetical protein KDK36_20625 [Leptospiraceae bacterium]|nr:hypothetical protein [Leptospiraceae bacterium]